MTFADRVIALLDREPDPAIREIVAEAGRKYLVGEIEAATAQLDKIEAALDERDAKRAKAAAEEEAARIGAEREAEQLRARADRLSAAVKTLGEDELDRPVVEALIREGKLEAAQAAVDEALGRRAELQAAVDATKVPLTWRGAWQRGALYAQGSVVLWKTLLYLALGDTQDQPDDNGWLQLTRSTQTVVLGGGGGGGGTGGGGTGGTGARGASGGTGGTGGTGASGGTGGTGGSGGTGNSGVSGISGVSGVSGAAGGTGGTGGTGAAGGTGGTGGSGGTGGTGAAGSDGGGLYMEGSGICITDSDVEDPVDGMTLTTYDTFSGQVFFWTRANGSWYAVEMGGPVSCDPGAGDLDIELLTYKNSSGTGATDSVSPASGGLLIATISAGSNIATFTPGGSLSGTWTLVKLVHDGSFTEAVYICSDYGASGTVQFTPSFGTWVTVGVFLATASDLDVSDVEQFKNWSASTDPSLSFDATPTYGTFVFVEGGGASAFTAGTGYVELYKSAAWDDLEVIWSATGTVPVTYDNAQPSHVIGVELKQT